MRVVVSFPKLASYEGRGADTVRTHDAIYKEYLDILVKANVVLEYFIEDTLAVKMIERYGLADKIRTVKLTYTCPADLTFADQQRDLVNLPDNVYSEYSDAKCIVSESDRKTAVPITLLREDRDKYIKERVKLLEKRSKEALNEYVSNRETALQFRTDSSMDRGTAVCNSASMGDGKLRIEIHLNGNPPKIFYGGVYVTKDYLEPLLNQ